MTSGTGDPSGTTPKAPPMTARAALLSALPDFALAGTYLITWIAPLSFGASSVSTLVNMMVVEFPVLFIVGIVSAISADGVSRRQQVIVTLFYGTVIGLVVGLGMMRSVTIVFTTWAQILNRLSPILVRRVSRAEAMVMTQRYLIMGIGLYFACAIAGFLPFPRLGLAPHAMDLAWIPPFARARPHGYMAWGITYFAAMGLAELTWVRRAASWSAEAPGSGAPVS